MAHRKSIYFASDLHLGLPTDEAPHAREERIVNWLHQIKPSAEELFLLGDVFDFWFEYRHVVPKGYIRFLGTLADLTDSGIAVHILTGNHDVWLFDYLPREIGVDILKGPLSITRHGCRFYICHGDEVGERPLLYRGMRTLFHARCAQRLFAWLVHPDLALTFGDWWSHRSRKVKPIAHSFRGGDEPLIRFFTNNNATDKHSLYLAGHLHTPVMHLLPDGTPAVILGDWINSFTYAEWDGERLSLNRFNENSEATSISTVELRSNE